jgi:TonB family protein
VHDDVQFQLDSDPVATAALHSGAISNRFGSSEPEATAPKLVHMVGRILPVARLASEENNAYVAVRLKVDERGLPENLTIAHSAGTSIDEQTLAAVRQYRFQPATVDHAPVESTVIVQVKLKK